MMASATPDPKIATTMPEGLRSLAAIADQIEADAHRINSIVGLLYDLTNRRLEWSDEVALCDWASELASASTGIYDGANHIAYLVDDALDTVGSDGGAS
jgi:hypothetical protein